MLALTSRRAICCQCSVRTFASTSRINASDLPSRLREAMKESMRARNAERTSVLKSALAAIQNSQHLASPPAPIKTLFKAIQQREAAILEFRSNGSKDAQALAEQYQREVEVLGEFIGKSSEQSASIAPEELVSVLTDLLKELGLEKTAKSSGQLIKTALTRLSERATPKQIADAARTLFMRMCGRCTTSCVKVDTNLHRQLRTSLLTPERLVVFGLDARDEGENARFGLPGIVVYCCSVCASLW
ncbi:uncharacterized protein L969DRAFT_104585 [Mixia osmundae IAM 14324]|uniref:Altered inheritance of mitochondria protein 41 n=1 Tax=Mixia osmundae (strain CBS 9802 / IAM 14324 / JCM 22182 / KY 12970) TaxID=764103 RepID=G7DSH4_MIXOS|nr:uncharacterized protein L969DRAFT_104585 [Mixia osmundae IAM 14324]KEI37968.1 hypothetical protein L969DRAFT_104585 [Mixia osmundae IAM 14324]GAA93534.1 hypothetical protein E5Q_00178 [Mixia osmundae IAM 14324]